MFRPARKFRQGPYHVRSQTQPEWIVFLGDLGNQRGLVGLALKGPGNTLSGNQASVKEGIDVFRHLG